MSKSKNKAVKRSPFGFRPTTIKNSKDAAKKGVLKTSKTKEKKKKDKKEEVKNIDSTKINEKIGSNELLLNNISIVGMIITYINNHTLCKTADIYDKLEIDIDKQELNKILNEISKEGIIVKEKGDSNENVWSLNKLL